MSLGKIGKRKYIRKLLRKNPNLDRKYIASCYGKIKFAKVEAQYNASTKPSIVRAYKCQYCKYWHVGRKKEMK